MCFHNNWNPRPSELELTTIVAGIAGRGVVSGHFGVVGGRFGVVGGRFGVGALVRRRKS